MNRRSFFHRSKSLRAFEWRVIVRDLGPWLLVLVFLAVNRCAAEPADGRSDPKTKPLLFVLQAVDRANVSERQLGAVDGLSIRVTWSALEPLPGNFDWQFLDQQVARCEKRDKPFQLRMLAGESTPDWYFENREGVAFRSRASGKARMPVPWSDALHERLALAYEALGKRYGNNPRLHTVHLSGVSRRSAEMHQPPELISHKGYSAENMTAAWSKLAATIQEQFPKSFVSLNLTRQPYTAEVASKCQEILQEKAVFQHNSLKASTRPLAPHHQWIVQLAKQGQLTAFQMVGPSANRARFGGTIEQAYALGDATHPIFYEIYRGDVPHAAVRQSPVRDIPPSP